MYLCTRPIFAIFNRYMKMVASSLTLANFFFSDPAVQALQFLDVIGMKDPSQKSQFFRTTLTQVFPFIPRKLWFQHTWPLLEQEVRSQEVLAAVLEPVLFLVRECSPQEYCNIILPVLR